MNEHDEHRFGESVHRALQASAQQLPYRVVLRLEKSRQAALLHVPGARPLARTAPPARRGATAMHVSRDGTAALGPDDSDLPGWWRTVFSILPIVAVVIGLSAISDWVDATRADEMAEVDLAMLVDDLPIDAYADRGFGVFVKNTSEQ